MEVEREVEYHQQQQENRDGERQETTRQIEPRLLQLKQMWRIQEIQGST